MSIHLKYNNTNIFIIFFIFIYLFHQVLFTITVRDPLNGNCDRKYNYSMKSKIIKLEILFNFTKILVKWLTQTMVPFTERNICFTALFNLYYKCKRIYPAINLKNFRLVWYHLLKICYIVFIQT